MNGVLIKPLPYPNADELIGVWHTAPGLGIESANISPSMFFTYHDGNRTFRDAVAFASSAPLEGFNSNDPICAEDKVSVACSCATVSCSPPSASWSGWSSRQVWLG